MLLFFNIICLYLETTIIYWGSWAADQIGSRNYAEIKHKAVDEIIQKITNAKSRKKFN